MHNPETLAHLFADIMNSHDATRFAELVTEDYVNHNPNVGPGRAGLIGFMTHWFDTLADTRVTVEDVLATGTSVVGRFTYRARHTGAFMGVTATGAAITMRSIDIWRVRDGMFAEHWDELNTLELFQQLGAVTMAGGRS